MLLRLVSRVRPSFFLCWIVKIDLGANLKLRFVRSMIGCVRRPKLFELMFKWSQITHTRTILENKGNNTSSRRSRTNFLWSKGGLENPTFYLSVALPTVDRFLDPIRLRPQNVRRTINFLIRPKWRVYNWPFIDSNHRNSLWDRLSVKLSQRSTDKRIVFIREQLWVSKIVSWSRRVKPVEAKSYHIFQAEISA